jgi:S1-C subfamily serine protease
MADVQIARELQTGAMSTVTNDLSGLSQAVVDLVARTVNGVVAVKAAPYRTASGISIGDNLIAVADHILKREERVSVQAADGTQAEAAVLGRDPGVDLAILKAEGLNAKPLSERDPTSVKPGMLLTVVGLTVDVGPSASLGIMGAVGGSRRTWRGGTLDHFFRLDVNVYPSQSGAAVVDSEGSLIGLATPALLRNSSVAVPVVTVKRIAQELLQQGRIRRGYLGVGLQPVAIPAGLREKIGSAQESGLIILSVEADSSAEKAGLHLGDILISLDDKTMAEAEDLQAALRGDRVGKPVRLKLLRGGEAVETQITISERPKKVN